MGNGGPVRFVLFGGFIYPAWNRSLCRWEGVVCPSGRNPRTYRFVLIGAFSCQVCPNRNRKSEGLS